VIVAATTNRLVIALSSESGDIYWEHRKHGPFMVPAVSDGSRLYLATSDVRGRVYALRLIDGKEEWEEDHAGLSAPMIMADGHLYLATEMGVISALRTRDGDQVWQTALGAPTAAAPVLLGDRLVVSTIRDTIYALDREGGEILDQRPVPSRVSAAPASDTSTLYLPLRSGHVLALETDGLEERWRAHVEGPVLASPVARRDGTVFALAGSGGVWSISPDGQPTKLADLGSAAVGGLTVTANAVLVGLLDGRLVALSPDDGRELWTVKLGDSVVNPPVVQDGCIYVPLRRGRVVKLR
jgi:outer membrane protein assembly factor BamB